MKVYLLKYTEGGEEIVAVTGFGTHSAKSAAEIQPSRKGVQRMIDFAIDKKHSSLLNFPYYVVTIEEASRSFTHQWVRYRMAAHLQQSLRYVNVDPGGYDWFVTPPSILRQGTDSIVEYVKNQQAAGTIYDAYLDEGIPKEDARFTLPIGTKTHISSAFNAEEYLHIITQRTCLDAQWEIRSAANAIMLAGMIVHPLIFNKAGPSCISNGICLGSKEGACKDEVEDLKKALQEVADHYRTNFNRLNDDTELKIDLTDILGYEVPKEVKKEVWEEFGEEFPLDWEVTLFVRKNWTPNVTEK